MLSVSNCNGFYVKVCVFVATLAIFLKTATALNCYQCSGSDPTQPFQCNEWLNSDIDIQPDPCDIVYDAKYCVKHTGRFEVSSIQCYQCSSQDSLDCTDMLIHSGGELTKGCDHVFEAQYCVKMIALDGGIGAKRFCSSLDLGNYCNYVQQPGDILSYRTCVYTCSGDGCNPAATVEPGTTMSKLTIMAITALLTATALLLK